MTATAEMGQWYFSQQPAVTSYMAWIQSQGPEWFPVACTKLVTQLWSSSKQS